MIYKVGKKSDWKDKSSEKISWDSNKKQIGFADCPISVKDFMQAVNKEFPGIDHKDIKISAVFPKEASLTIVVSEGNPCV